MEIPSTKHTLARRTLFLPNIQFCAWTMSTFGGLWGMEMEVLKRHARLDIL
ncbi:hypothetical protein PanWU01x14_229080 [Parasponia andersonii]|uniref:Uncharacterized protein n=1 Tax=Parasponia andersonii TaxID=3476 RepID=A0A2P5BLB3_PARAD|nr:hypothetical protein PanWU01x14_229080 [Parasponia andersonii]